MSPIAHSGMALLGWQLASSRKTIRTLGLFILIANIPDIDFFLFLVFGKNRLSIHQYFTHNLVFILAVAALFSLVLPAGRDRWGLVLTGLSHLVLDLFVIDPARPIGIRLLFPFGDKVFNFGVFPYLNRSAWFSVRNVLVLLLEAAVFIVPVLIIFRKTIFRSIARRDFWTA